MDKHVFEALSAETLPLRLSGNAALCDRIGGDHRRWQVKEVGDGNLNLVFIVTGEMGAAIVKQALPYVRLVGERWPLPLKRSFFEYHALTRQAARDPGMVPEILFFDAEQAMIIMEYLAPHVILRRALIEGRKLPKIGRDLGLFAARTLFRGSDLSMPTRDKKADLALFADNVELCDITENLVFSDPYFEAEMNRHTTPHLDSLVEELRRDRDLKVEAQRLKHIFSAKAETLCHGDLHTGSVMVTDDETRVIDPEFAFYGPISFDVGMLLANFWMSYFSQGGHESAAGERDQMRAYLLDTAETIWQTFCDEFTALWRSERKGILYQASLFEDRADPFGAEQALTIVLDEIYREMLGFAGVEILRRILGLAHNADFETIADLSRRAKCESKALKLGRHLAVNRDRIASLWDIRATAERLQQETLS
ncbi:MULTISPECIES: S-methyl-5-thioribose kinase [unclassified Ensifer]|uniref:S-methyl-5-thioribose kinase n=1 Tax=unclassified Ensifer TaxID=2633371 RepID=UPI00070FB9D0|nr:MULTISPECIES: S-methyl-5-thioribose kinase [unclassified Ensifer]KQW57754.1 methylthioribose kinase [Ensifer sp. Root1252]KQW79978.1 methylthioribose kinase [Ensifer sp. Root127]KRC60026.1 methylthioribose kinase [Ensifer sp. Root231]KRC96748.1 methylthioribose kinase [Ensifer sp. Root258]PSS60681.1 S-methyl-5-thioribose kinase [Ensifer sp. NM-2]